MCGARLRGAKRSGLAGPWPQNIDILAWTCRLNRQNREWTSFVVVGWNVAAAGVVILIKLTLMSTVESGFVWSLWVGTLQLQEC